MPRAARGAREAYRIDATKTAQPARELARNLAADAWHRACSPSAFETPMNTLNKAWLAHMVRYNTQDSFEYVERIQLAREQRRLVLLAASVLVAFWLASVAAEIFQRGVLETSPFVSDGDAAFNPNGVEQ